VFHHAGVPFSSITKMVVYRVPNDIVAIFEGLIPVWLILVIDGRISFRLVILALKE